MKKFMLTLTMLLTMLSATDAMSYEQARNQALFLADKMAYELNLTEDQYEAAYEINLDYLMGVNSYDDLYGAYWRQRNLDMSYVLLDWQYRAYCAASYFYRPLYWSDGFWHFGIYLRYPRRNYFYYGRPSFINIYVGGHSWRNNGGRSWYHGRDWGRPMPGGPRGDNAHFGMRDGFKRGDYNRGFDFARSNRGQMVNRSNSNFGGMRGNNNPRPANSNFGGRTDNSRPGNGSFGGMRNNQPVNVNGNGTPRRNDNNSNRNNSPMNDRRNDSARPANGSFGGMRGSSSTRDNFGARESSTRTTVRNSGGNFGGARGTTRSQTPANSFMPSTRSSQPASRSSFGGGSRGNVGGGSQNGGGAHFGGRR